jgi:hypothetical protein
MQKGDEECHIDQCKERNDKNTEVEVSSRAGASGGCGDWRFICQESFEQIRMHTSPDWEH